MNMFAEYKASTKLQSTFKEQKAKDERHAQAPDERRRKSYLTGMSSVSSDGSLLLSPVSES